MNQTILAIDPGPTESAFVIWTGSAILHMAKLSNENVLGMLETWPTGQYGCVIEKVASYGMPVGAEVFETVYWAGIFAHCFGLSRVDRVTRGEVKMHLCQSMRAKDKNVRQALIDRFGAPGCKAAPGLLYGVKADIWAALALAVTWHDKYREVKGAA